MEMEQVHKEKVQEQEEDKVIALDKLLGIMI